MRGITRGDLAASSIRVHQIHPTCPKSGSQEIPLHLRHGRLQTQRAPLHLHAFRRPDRTPQPPPPRNRNARLSPAISLPGPEYQPRHHSPSSFFSFSYYIRQRQQHHEPPCRNLPAQILEPPPRSPNRRPQTLALRHTAANPRSQMGLLLRRRALVPRRHDARARSPTVEARALLHHCHAAEVGF